MKVFRVENNLGEGPFASSGPSVYGAYDLLYRAGLISEENSPWRHPGPSGDKLLSKKVLEKYYCIKDAYKKYIFGFESVEAFKLWFDHSVLREEMNKYFKLNEYRVHSRSVAKGSVQLMFDKSKATLVASHSLTI